MARTQSRRPIGLQLDLCIKIFQGLCVFPQRREHQTAQRVRVGALPVAAAVLV
jgi:hypothetical protein